MRRLKLCGAVTILLALGAGKAQAGVNDVADYVAVPHFMSAAVKPRILIIFDNSVEMSEMAYWQEVDPAAAPSTAYDPLENYYGNFATGTIIARAKYAYVNNEFVRDDLNGKWDGNFLNWLCMRKVDVARKVLGMDSERHISSYLRNAARKILPEAF